MAERIEHLFNQPRTSVENIKSEVVERPSLSEVLILEGASARLKMIVGRIERAENNPDLRTRTEQLIHVSGSIDNILGELAAKNDADTLTDAELELSGDLLWLLNTVVEPRVAEYQNELNRPPTAREKAAKAIAELSVDLDIEGLDVEKGLAWIRGKIPTLESAYDKRFDGYDLYTQLDQIIQQIKQFNPEVGDAIKKEFDARGHLQNDVRSHSIDAQGMTDVIKNPDMSAGDFGYFFKEMNSQGIPVAHARRLLSRAFMGRLLNPYLKPGEKFDVNAYTFVANEPAVAKTVIQRLQDESGKAKPGGGTYKKVTEDQATLAYRMASRLALIEHERALQEATMKQNRPDKFRDYMHFDARQLYYGGVDRTSASFVAQVYLFAEPAIVEAMRKINPNFQPVILLYPRIESAVAEENHHSRKITIKAKPTSMRRRRPSYTFVGDFYTFARTTKEESELLYDKEESRWRYKLLSDVVANKGDVDEIYGYELASGDRQHEQINWDALDPTVYSLWIDQLFNVKTATDKFFIKKDVPVGDAEKKTFYEDLTTPIDYALNTTYRVRDAKISLKDIARSVGIRDKDVLDKLSKKDPSISPEDQVAFLLSQPQMNTFITNNGLNPADVHQGLLHTAMFDKKDFRMQMQAVVLLGWVLENHVDKNPGLHGRWDQASEQQVTEVLESAAQAGFITHEDVQWIQSSIPRTKVLIKEALHAIASRARKEGT